MADNKKITLGQLGKALERVEEEKQDKITGVAGQVVGFDTKGKPVAQEAPSGGVSSWNDLLDRPFYSKTTTIFNAKVEIPFLYGTMYMLNLDTTIPLVAGSTYRVVIDGEEYIITACDADGTVYLGDGSLAGGTSTGHDFTILTSADGTSGIVSIRSDEVATWTREILIENIIIIKIDEMYLPDSVSNASKMRLATVVIPSSGWTTETGGTYFQTVSVEAIEATSSNVFVQPVNRTVSGSVPRWHSTDCYLASWDSGDASFRCKSMPDGDIEVILLIFNNYAE